MGILRIFTLYFISISRSIKVATLGQTKNHSSSVLTFYEKPRVSKRGRGTKTGAYHQSKHCREHPTLLFSSVYHMFQPVFHYIFVIVCAHLLAVSSCILILTFVLSRGSISSKHVTFEIPLVHTCLQFCFNQDNES